MPHYTLPEDSPDNHDDAPAITMDSYQKTVTIPVNDEILDMLSVGDKIDVTLMGEVTATRKNDGDEYEDRSITLKITSVDAYPEGDMEEMEAHEGLSRGFQKAYKHR